MIFSINLDLEHTDINNLHDTLNYLNDNINKEIKNNKIINIWGCDFAIYDLKLNGFNINIHFSQKNGKNYNIKISIK